MVCHKGTKFMTWLDKHLFHICHEILLDIRHSISKKNVLADYYLAIYHGPSCHFCKEWCIIGTITNFSLTPHDWHILEKMHACNVWHWITSHKSFSPQDNTDIAGESSPYLQQWLNYRPTRKILKYSLFWNNHVWGWSPSQGLVIALVMDGV